MYSSTARRESPAEVRDTCLQRDSHSSSVVVLPVLHPITLGRSAPSFLLSSEATSPTLTLALNVRQALCAAAALNEHPPWSHALLRAFVIRIEDPKRSANATDFAPRTRNLPDERPFGQFFSAHSRPSPITISQTPMTMMRHITLALAALITLLQQPLVASLTTPRSGGVTPWNKQTAGTRGARTTVATASALSATGGAAAAAAAPAQDATKDYSGQAAALFGNLRIPAALFAGAAAGSAFAMPLAATDGLAFGTAKRFYALLMMASLSAQIITIIVSTLAMGAMSFRPTVLTSSTSELLNSQYDFEWVAARLHFLLGIIMFVTGCGLRAWVSIACPFFAKAAVGLIFSSTVFCVAVINEREHEDSGSSVWAVPFKFVRLLSGRARSQPLFAVSFLVFISTAVYMGVNAPHIYKYLAV